MIFDCFTFFDEVDVAEIRFREMESLPDLIHVAVFAETDHRGNAHSPPIEELRARASGRGTAANLLAWCSPRLGRGYYPRERESIQRNEILNALAGFATTGDDVVIISDVDEIPRASVVAEYAANRTGLHSLKMGQHCYWLNGVVRDTTWPHARIMRRRDMEWFGSPDHIRLAERTLPQIAEAGWHFSWCGGVEAVRKKLRSFSHRELDIPEFHDPERIRRAMDGDKKFWDGADLDFVPIDETFPACVRENPEKWSHLIKGGPA